MTVAPPLATIVIPSRNRPTFARRAVTCALGQVDAAVDVVVVDDGSDHPLVDALADVVATDDRLRVLRNDMSVGVAAARNRGLVEARGEWVGFCDDDDVWAPTKVRDQLRPASDQGAVWSCSGAMAIDPALRPLYAMRAPDGPVPTGNDLLSRNLIPGGASTVLVRTDVMRAAGGFDPAFSTLADWEMWIRLGRAGLLVGVDRPLVGYLIHPHGMSNDTGLLRRDMDRLRTKHAMEYECADTAVDQRLWQSYIAYRALNGGHRLGAARAFAAAAVAGRTTRPAAGAALALISPRWVLERRSAMARGDIPANWIDEASWLDHVDEQP